jgi:lysophospholipase L1-like esterase
MKYQRFVALGDSCTEGLDDPYPGGELYRGWADLVAGNLATGNDGFRYANLGVRGRRLDQILVEQVPTAAELEPDLIALFGGGNDVLTRGFDPGVVGHRVEAAVRAVAAIAPTALVFTLSDITARMPFGYRMRPRIHAVNAALREAADAHGAILVDLSGDNAAMDLRYFGQDRLHLAERGHQRVAAHMLGALGLPFAPAWLAPLPGLPEHPTLRSQAEWVYRQVLPVAMTRVRNRVVGRSPGDGMLPKRPELLPVRFDERGSWTPAPIPGNA